ncbi:MAG: hypothetical protein ACOYOK_05855 [Pseudobdellovibrionaceae bacterium]
MKENKNSAGGFVTAEFIFSFTIAASLCIVLFAVTYTLAVVEVAQYLTFSTARSFIGSHIDQDKQEEVARKKYKELLGNKVIASIFSGSGWFKLSGSPDIRGAGDSGKTFDDYATSDENRMINTGVRVDFGAELLGSLKLPFIGNTQNPSGDGYTTKITTLLIREPTFKECWDLHVKPRYQKILDLENGRFKELGSKGASKYIPIGDNGC